ncbi:hypothetical protein [Piscinibacter sp. XHJ-5]|uniref:hypothetical protein n=1 Tax=Piscinibacter sp. XHJ-5 TaxID=3037797 RepID=UPI002452874E|nr:hypothetical protein [Piscinibacter sp. XHJ-5]
MKLRCAQSIPGRCDRPGVSEETPGPFVLSLSKGRVAVRSPFGLSLSKGCVAVSNPFGLSLSKGCVAVSNPFGLSLSKLHTMGMQLRQAQPETLISAERPFDKLRANGLLDKLRANGFWSAGVLSKRLHDACSFGSGTSGRERR